ncbi:ribosome-associated translation inhibitor RaiA [Candidatus Falkowbacteria bacterium]|uniref:Ribosomal subunit interface protein n=1 Tax=Candidatus Falkowbacteria bacterium CG10_big_fil_rev_8_21_14_0_10_37_18 TaxID=1974562 RepID=A0A2H0V8Q3_9BACT|nr:ribosome-associated translation inhibitor RaiA [Candidatus Falkowbacteria bacterium]NCQ12606.1 ribosome-associated translation inhibitor RaiA [Candidatus Falkowbacteria bacterium]OIO05567.1 MAG: ribosomal subunit interface protein [Candidatus Falkowbacteria bacterium CG1_02_37_21]PIR95494.1 MAG: ribosomal subunit interface protein [Candidatus Falkowbacteria bacterium CG10_big_fil_rev_8_21_14_0_10_37_18]
MNIKIKATRIEMTKALKDYVEAKISSVSKYLGKIKSANCEVEISKSVGGQNKGEIYRAEVNLDVPGKLLRVEKTEKDLYKAIDKVKDHLEMIIKKYKEKMIDSARGK